MEGKSAGNEVEFFFCKVERFVLGGQTNAYVRPGSNVELHMCQI